MYCGADKKILLLFRSREMISPTKWSAGPEDISKFLLRNAMVLFMISLLLPAIRPSSTQMAIMRVVFPSFWK